MLRRWFRKKYFDVHDTKQLVSFENALGYVFSDMRFLKRALSHKSYANEKKLGVLEHNERLEFLGDAVLELAISDLLHNKFSDSREGEMSKIRASLVNETALAELARRIKIGSHIFLGKGEDQGAGREKNSLLADAFEATLGAIYLDGGFDAAFRIVKKYFEPELDRATSEDISRDYKTKLQEEAQLRFREPPEYRLVAESGPDHAKTFEVQLLILGEQVSTGQGRSKKQAEQDAAQKALQALNDSWKPQSIKGAS